MVGSPQQPERVEIPEVQAALTRLDFPATPGELAERAAERRADERVVVVLGRLPGRRYEQPADVLDAVRDLDPASRDVPAGSPELGAGTDRS